MRLWKGGGTEGEVVRGASRTGRDQSLRWPTEEGHEAATLHVERRYGSVAVKGQEQSPAAPVASHAVSSAQRARHPHINTSATQRHADNMP